MDTNTTATIFGRINTTTWRNNNGTDTTAVLASLYDTEADTTVDLALYESETGDVEAFTTNLLAAVGVLAPYCDTFHEGYFAWEGRTLTGFPVNETWLGSTIDAIAADYRSNR